MTSPTLKQIDIPMLACFNTNTVTEVSRVAEIKTQTENCSVCISHERCMVSRLVEAARQSAARIVSRTHTAIGGECLFREGDTPEALYVVKSGSAKVYFTTEDGAEQVVAFYMPGDVLGLDALGIDEHRTSAVALERTALCVVPIQNLEEICARISGSSRCIYTLLSDELGRDYRTLGLITKKDAEAKMASFLMMLSARFRVRGFSAHNFNLSMKRNEIGSYLGIAVETVSRIFTRFQEEGLVRVERRRVQILDATGLKEVAGGGLRVFAGRKAV